MPFAAISAGTSIIGGLIGSSAAGKAAKQQAAANQAAAGAVNQATSGAINAGYSGITESNAAINQGTAAANQAVSNAGTAQQNIYNTETGTVQPYQQAGLQGLSQLAANTGTFSFDPNNVTNNPGYQFELKQGEQAIQNSAAASGMLNSGATMKAMDQYASGLAATNEQNLYNQALSTYNTNLSGMQSLAGLGTTANSQALSAGENYGGQLTSLANLGANVNMQGAGLLSNTAMQGNQYVGTIGLQGANQAGNFYVGAGNAQAAGTMGAANAWSNALGGVGNAAQTVGLSQMLSPFSGGTGWGGGTSTGGFPQTSSVSYGIPDYP